MRERISYTATEANTALQAIQLAGGNRVHLVVPTSTTPATEIGFTLPTDTARTLSAASASLELSTSATLFNRVPGVKANTSTETVLHSTTDTSVVWADVPSSYWAADDITLATGLP